MEDTVPRAMTCEEAHFVALWQNRESAFSSSMCDAEAGDCSQSFPRRATLGSHIVFVVRCSLSIYLPPFPEGMPGGFHMELKTLKDPGRHECHGSWISNTPPGWGGLGQLPSLEGGSYGSGWEAGQGGQPVATGRAVSNSVGTSSCDLSDL